MTITTSRTAFYLLLLVSFVWGAEFVLVDLSIAELPTNTFNAIRFFIAGLAILPIYYFSAERNQTKSYAKLLPISLGLGLLLFIGFYTQTEGMHYTSVSNAGFITGLCVPLVSILGFLFFKSKTSLAAWIGIVAATTGLYLLTVGDKLEFNDGDLLVLICAFAFAFHIIITGKVVKGLPVLLLSCIQLFAVAVYSLTATMLSPDPVFYHPDIAPVSAFDQLSKPIIWASIFITGVFGTAYAYWAQTACQKILQPHKVALVFATEPVFACMAAWIFLDERLGWLGFVGAGLIIAGMLISELGDKEKQVEIDVLDHTSSAP
jgi:drug/metabolite transporter (DMT)-like permease